jgi:hypothetical protein
VGYRLSPYFGHIVCIQSSTIGTSLLAFGAFDKQTIQDDSVLDGNTNTIGPTAAVHPSHLQEFDNKENDAPVVAVEDDINIYSAQ